VENFFGLQGQEVGFDKNLEQKESPSGELGLWTISKRFQLFIE